MDIQREREREKSFLNLMIFSGEREFIERERGEREREALKSVANSCEKC